MLKTTVRTGVACNVQPIMRCVARVAPRLSPKIARILRQQPLEPTSVDTGPLVLGMSDLLRRSLGEQIAVETVLAGGLWSPICRS